MKLHRIYAIFLNNYFIFKRSIDRKTELFYWPILDLILWGVTSLYFREISPEAANIVPNIVSGILLWFILWQAQNEVNLSILQQIWYQNIMNLFVSPLKFKELLFSFMMNSILKIIVMFSLTSVVAYFVYDVFIYDLGWWLLPFALVLMMTGWAYAFLMSGVILRLGSKVQSLTWTLVMLLSPFSGVYFPTSLLPSWGEAISKVLPTSYIFESMRQLNETGTNSPEHILFAIVLSVLYFTLGFIWINKGFDYAIEQGLVKLK